MKKDREMNFKNNEINGPVNNGNVKNQNLLNIRLSKKLKVFIIIVIVLIVISFVFIAGGFVYSNWLNSKNLTNVNENNVLTLTGDFKKELALLPKTNTSKTNILNNSKLNSTSSKSSSDFTPTPTSNLVPIPSSTLGNNLAINGNFEVDASPWRGRKSNGDELPGVTSLETNDTNGTLGSLKVTILQQDDVSSTSNKTGALCLFSKIVKGGGKTFNISFRAKSISGSPIINIARTNGGGEVQIPINTKWDMYTVSLKINPDDPDQNIYYETRDLIFSLVSDPLVGNAPQRLKNGVFLLDDVNIVESNNAN